MDHIDRIRKLLAMADSTTFPAEAKAFRTKARKMIEQHGVTEAQIHPPSMPRPVIVQGWGNAWGIPGFGNGTANHTTFGMGQNIHIVVVFR
jgi:hypothetical protein